MKTSKFNKLSFFSVTGQLTILDTAKFLTKAFGPDAGSAWLQNTLNAGQNDLLRKSPFGSQFIFSESPEGHRYWMAKWDKIESAYSQYKQEHGL